MHQLNTVFKHKSNTLCNNNLFNSLKISAMHEQMDRLYKAARVLKKIEGQSAVARLLNASPQTLKNWESRGISRDGMITAQEIIGCSSTWLKSGEGEMVAGGASVSSDQNVVPVSMGTRRIPLVSYVQAGTMTDIVDPYPIGAASDWLLTDLELGPNAFALTIKGDSMFPDFKEGDAIIVDPAVVPLPGDFVVAKNGENEATFKKYRPRGVNEAGQEVFELVPLNEDYPSMRSDLKPIKIIGTMVEHRRYRRR